MADINKIKEMESQMIVLWDEISCLMMDREAMLKDVLFNRNKVEHEISEKLKRVSKMRDDRNLECHLYEFEIVNDGRTVLKDKLICPMDFKLGVAKILDVRHYNHFVLYQLIKDLNRMFFVKEDKIVINVNQIR